MKRIREMLVFLPLLPFVIGGAAISAAVCFAVGYTGAALPAMFAVWGLAGFVGIQVLYVLVIGVFTLFIDKSKPQMQPNRFFSALITYTCGWLCALSRVRIHMNGLEKIPEGRFLLVGNHRSCYDPIVTLWALRDYALAFISKQENMKLPIVGHAIHKACFLPIDRDNDRAALRTILTAADYLKRGVVSVGIYPEGRRTAGEGMQPFRNGAFKIAQKARTPIVILAVKATEFIKKRAPWRITDVYLTVCGVMDAETVAERNTAEIGEEVIKCINSASF